MATKKTPTPEPEPVPVATRPACLCGCGGFPKGKNARYVPGHDARHHAAIAKAAKEQEA